MSRPQKTGLDYFPVVTEWDQKLRLIKAKYKLLGVGCIIELWRAVYREGYALTWTEDAELLFADENSIDLETLQDIVRFAVDRGIFSREKLNEAHVLTSHGIQKQWLGVAQESHRKNTAIDPSLCLLTNEELLGNKVPAESSGGGVSSGGNPAPAVLPPGEIPQSKAKQSKANLEELASGGVVVDNFPKTPEEEARFYGWALKKAKANPKNRDPAKVAKNAIMKDPEEAKTWRGEEAAEKAAHYLRCPEPPACECGGKIKADRHDGTGQCVECGIWYEYQEGWGWLKAAEQEAVDGFDKTG